MKKILMKKIKYRMCLVFRFKAFQVILNDSWNTHITCIIFKPHEKTNKNIFHKLFSICKNYKQLLSKTQRKALKKARERYQNLSEEEKDKRRKKAQERY